MNTETVLSSAHAYSLETSHQESLNTPIVSFFQIQWEINRMKLKWHGSSVKPAGSIYFQHLVYTKKWWLLNKFSNFRKEWGRKAIHSLRNRSIPVKLNREPTQQMYGADWWFQRTRFHFCCCYLSLSKLHNSPPRQASSSMYTYLLSLNVRYSLWRHKNSCLGQAKWIARPTISFLQNSFMRNLILMLFSGSGFKETLRWTYFTMNGEHICSRILFSE